MKNNTIQFMTRTAVMLALTILFQFVRYLFPDPNAIYVTYIISSCVNLCLIVAGGVIGMWSGVIISVLAPIVAFFQGHAIVQMILPVALGNAVIAAGAAIGFKRIKNLWVTFLAAGAKYAVIAFGMVFFVFMATKGQGFAASVSAALTAQFVQLPTAVIGVIIAVPVISALRRALHIDTAT